MATQLPIEEDLRFERAERRFATLLWYVLLALMGATLLGLFGNGPISSTRAGAPGDALWLEFDRFGRLGSAMRTSVHVRFSPDGTIPLTINREYLDAIRIVEITPEPDAAAIVADGVRYTFTSLAEPAVVTIDFEARRLWSVRGRIAGAGIGRPLEHFIYP